MYQPYAYFHDNGVTIMLRTLHNIFLFLFPFMCAVQHQMVANACFFCSFLLLTDLMPGFSRFSAGCTVKQ
uniref:Uncharacterized protein n=1 Tax=Rhizophora mucronata TaxID=61149 RepID=A0A2P2QST1_RHIMU